MDKNHSRASATRIGERIAILLEKGYSESKAALEYPNLIYFRNLNLMLLTRYMTAEKLLGRGTFDQQLNKLSQLGFEDHPFGAFLLVDWNELKTVFPKHLFFYKALLANSQHYDEIEFHHTFNEIVDNYCKATFAESPASEYDCPTDKDALIARLTLIATLRSIDNFKEFLADCFDADYFDHSAEINLPNSLAVFLNMTQP